MLFENSNKVRRGFFTHPTAIAPSTRGPPRLQLALFMGLASTAMLLWENQHWQKTEMC